MGGDLDAVLPARVRAARWLLRRWPLPRGADRLESLLLRGYHGWPARGDVDFHFGRLVDVSLDAWPKGYRQLLLRGVMEDAEVAVWRAVLRPGDDVVDGGANIGYWSLVAAGLVGPRGRVFAFEPVPATADQLERNVAASRSAAVRVVRAALAAEPGEVVLHLFAGDTSAVHSSVGAVDGLSVVASTTVPAMPLDEFLGSEGAAPALVKLDVEGSETEALRGARGLLDRAEPPILCCEWNEAAARAAGSHPRVWLEMLAGSGYRFYMAERGGRLRPFEAPADGSDWIPMVWCVPGRGQLRERLAHLLPR